MPQTLSTQARHPKVKHPLESLEMSADFTLLLAPGELLQGAPTITGAGDLNTAISGLGLNTAPYLNDAEEGGSTVAIGCGVQFRVGVGGVDKTTYALAIACGTTLGNTRVVVCLLVIRAG